VHEGQTGREQRGAPLQVVLEQVEQFLSIEGSGNSRRICIQKVKALDTDSLRGRAKNDGIQLLDRGSR
jgi:hypothetical protein